MRVSGPERSRVAAPWLGFLGAAVVACSGGAENRSRPSGQAAGSAPPQVRYAGGDATHSRAADRSMLVIEAGSYIAGSTPEERERAYDDYRATAGHDAARNNGWFDREDDRQLAELPAFRIDQTPVTNVAYAEFLHDTGTKPPFIDEATWNRQRFVQRYHDQVTRFNWTSDSPPSGREDHPAVLVTWDEARAYCAWRGQVTGQPPRLPTVAEYEKAARGPQGLVYPWGNHWDPDKLNSQQKGPLDTQSVGSYPDGASPYGMLDAAGNVFEWTTTRWTYRAGRITVKGSAWDDYAGVGRGAAQHGRRPWIRHVLVGFRCAGD